MTARMRGIWWMSGHIFFADHWYGFDDALYAAVRLLGIVARMTGPLSAVRAALPRVVNTPELRFDCDDARKFRVIEEVAARLKADAAELSDIDGVRVRTADGWCCCGLLTPRRCWWRVPRRPAKPAWSG